MSPSIAQQKSFDRFGFRVGRHGTHVSRTIMLGELQTLLGLLPSAASRVDYRLAIIRENLLSKKTLATRRLTAKYLAELYALDPRIPIFRIFRQLWDADSDVRPLLALMCAAAR